MPPAALHPASAKAVAASTTLPERRTLVADGPATFGLRDIRGIPFSLVTTIYGPVVPTTHATVPTIGQAATGSEITQPRKRAWLDHELGAVRAVERWAAANGAPPVVSCSVPACLGMLIKNGYVVMAAVVAFLVVLWASGSSLFVAFGALGLISGLGWAI